MKKNSYWRILFSTWIGVNIALLFIAVIDTITRYTFGLHEMVPFVIVAWALTPVLSLVIYKLQGQLL